MAKRNDVDVRSIDLITYNGTVVPLEGVAQEFVIFHDLYQYGSYCELAILDSKGLIEMAPIVGDELLIIRFKTPRTEELLQYSFRVYSVKDRNQISRQSEAFVLCGCSLELINNGRKSVNKSYVDLTGDNIIKSIYSSFLKPEEEFGIVRKKKLFLQDSSNSQSIVFPNVNPFNAIRQVTTETQGKSRGFINTYDFNKYSTPSQTTEYEDASLASNFCFYEGYNGWHFKTLDYLLTQNKVDDFYLADAALEGQDKKESGIKPYQIIMNVTRLRQFDTLERFSTGMLFHNVETIDPILKRFTTDNFTYSKNFNSISHTEKNKSLFSKKSIYANDAGTTKTLYIMSNIGNEYQNNPLLSNAKNTDPQIRNPRRLHNFLKYDHASRLQLNNIVLEVTIPGNTTIEIGNVVNLHIPQNTQNDLYMGKDNLLFGNRFLVTAVRHNINSADENFFTVMECVKDVYAKDVVGEEVKLTTDDMEPEE